MNSVSDVIKLIYTCEADIALGLNKSNIYMPYVKRHRSYGFAKEPYKNVGT